MDCVIVDTDTVMVRVLVGVTVLLPRVGGLVTVEDRGVDGVVLFGEGDDKELLAGAGLSYTSM